MASSGTGDLSLRKILTFLKPGTRCVLVKCGSVTGGVEWVS